QRGRRMSAAPVTDHDVRAKIEFSECLLQQLALLTCGDDANARRIDLAHAPDKRGHLDDLGARSNNKNKCLRGNGARKKLSAWVMHPTLKDRAALPRRDRQPLSLFGLNSARPHHSPLPNIIQLNDLSFRLFAEPTQRQAD